MVRGPWKGFRGSVNWGANIYYFVEFLPVYVHSSGGGSMAFFRFSKGSVTPKKVKKNWYTLKVPYQYVGQDGYSRIWSILTKR